MIKQYTFDVDTAEHVSTWTIDGSIRHHVNVAEPCTRECVAVTVTEGADARNDIRRWFSSLPKWYQLRIWHEVPPLVRIP